MLVESTTGNVHEDILLASSHASPTPVRFSPQCEEGTSEAGGGWTLAFRLALNLLALTSAPFTFGFALYWLVSHVWWQGLAAILVAPFVALTLIAAATCVATLREHSSPAGPSVGGLL